MTLITQPSGALQKKPCFVKWKSSACAIFFLQQILGPDILPRKTKNSPFHKAFNCIFLDASIIKERNRVCISPTKNTPVSMCHTQAILAGTRNIFLLMLQEKNLCPRPPGMLSSKCATKFAGILSQLQSAISVATLTWNVQHISHVFKAAFP